MLNSSKDNEFELTLGRLESAPWVASTTVEPRPYQLRIVSKAIRMFEGTHRNRAGALDPAAHSVLVESPTGSGKTVMGLAISRYLQETHKLSIGWVSMRRNLLAQASEENRRWGFGVALRLISMFDRSPPYVDVLVVDEAQHDAAMTMASLHATIRPKKVLGLTATPFRTDRIKLCFDQVIKDAGIHQLIQDGYLSRYHHYTISDYTPEAVAQHLAADPERWGKSLVFFHRRQQCEECRERLSLNGIRSEVVTGQTNREQQIADFADGRVPVLINMLILSEGFDCPSLKTVFCRPSGRACTIQMGGRVFRKHADLPHKQIVQCKSTRHPFLRTAMADEQYVWIDGRWRSLTLNRELEAVSERTRTAIGRSQVRLPAMVVAHRRRQTRRRRRR